MVDSHCHLNFKAFFDDWREVLSRSFTHGITGLINVGSNYKTSQRAVDITKEYKQCFAAAGLHPIHVADEEFNLKKYHSYILKNIGVIKAIGETGLDYFHNEISNLKSLPCLPRLPRLQTGQPAGQISKPQLKTQNFKERQKKVFLKHLQLAREFSLPVILHCRGEVNKPLEAYHHLLLEISNLSFRPLGVIHCFSANWQIAKKFLELGFYIGFTGIITYKNCRQDLLKVVAKTPLEKILIETDAPYLAPEPYRGQRCEPWHVKFTAQKIAAIKKISLTEVIKQTSENAKRLFQI